MQNMKDWKETKFVRRKDGQWQASRTGVPVTSRLVADRAAEAYANAIALHANGRLVDLGCGNVPLFGMYRDVVDDIVCVDWQSGSHSSVHVDLFADLNAPLDLDESSFDTVIATDVIEHLHEPRALFSSAARALRGGGKLIIGVPFLYWIHEAPHDYHRYTKFALERMVRDAGLELIYLDAFGGPPEVLSDIAIKSFGRLRWLARLVYTITRPVVDFPPVRRWSKSMSATMPLGYVLVAQKKG